jgi:dipeptidyl aminopeptidase/acylaminoacyl peptidase
MQPMNPILRWIAALGLALVALTARADSVALAEYGRLPAMDLPALSASGRHVAFVATVEGQRRLLIMQPGRGAPVPVKLDIAQAKLRQLFWAGDDWLIGLFSSTTNLGERYGFDNELVGLFVVERSTGAVSWPLRRDGILDAALGVYGAHRIEGRWTLHVGVLAKQRSSSGAEWLSDGGVDLARFDLASGEMITVARGQRHLQRWVLDAQGRVLAHSRYDAGARRWSLHAGADNTPALVQHNDPTGGSTVHGLGRSEASVVFSLADDQADVPLREWSLAPGASAQAQLVPGSERFASLWFDRTSKRLLGLRRDALDAEPTFFAAADRARVDGVRRALAGYRLNYGSASDDLSRLLVHSAGADDPGTWWIVDVALGKADELGWDYPQIGAERVNPWRVQSYRAADGLALEGILTLPKGRAAEKLPLVVMPHGGPAAHDVPRFDWWAQAFASRGYAVWQPNFRGSTGYGIALRRAGDGQWGRKMQSDISDGVAELVRLGLVDAQRACIVGASYGGYAALAGVTLQQGRYRCAVAVAGVADLERMVNRPSFRYNLAARRYLETALGAARNDSAALDALSPARQAQRADAPVLLMHGRDDTVVPIEQSRVMQQALKAAGKAVELVELEGEDHHFSREATRIAMIEATLAFVQKHNPSAAR